MNHEIQFILYQLPDEGSKVQVDIKDETIWATQKALAQLFDLGGCACHQQVFESYLIQEKTKRQCTAVLQRCSVAVPKTIMRRSKINSIFIKYRSIF